MIPKVGAVRFTSLVMLVSYGCIAIHYGVISGMSVPIINSHVAFLAMMLGIMCTVVPTLCLSQAIYLIGSSNTALAGGVGPVSTVVFASLILGESLVGVQYFGIVLVLLGVGCLTALSGKQRTK